MASATSPTIVTIGAAFSANKGAASMLQALIDRRDDIARDARVIALTTYPHADREENPNRDVEVVSLTPTQILFPTLPLAIVIFLARLFGRSGRVFARTPALRALIEADVVADLAGIAFSDGRGIPTLGYNVLMTGIPLLVGAPVVKCSQALGPFEERPNRWAAKIVLPRVSEIIARGEGTRRYLLDLGLDNVTSGADLAFLMETPMSAEDDANSVLESVGNRPFVAIAPSSVVRAYCDDAGIDYIGLMAQTCDRLVADLDLDLVVLAHSARPGRPESRMNDLPACRDIVAAMASRERVELLDRSLLPSTLRAIIGRAEALITSRFHGMISGLAVATPTIVVGWSHKYEEVMRVFGLQDFVMTYQALGDGSIGATVGEAVARSEEIRDQIRGHLPSVRKDSASSIKALQRIAAGDDQTPEMTEGAPEASEVPGVAIDLRPVIASDMCIACGACVHADPTVRLELNSEKQIFEPSHPGNALAAAVCPAIAVDYDGLQKKRFPSGESTPFGVVESVMLAQSNNEDRNRRASSGGLIKELLRELIAQADVAGAIALSEVSGLDYRPSVISEADQVDSLPGSIYHNLPKDRVLDLLKASVKNGGGRYVLVGIPCEFEGIFQYIYTCAPELADSIHSTIGLLCGWQYSHHSIRAMAEFKGFDFDAIEAVSYRGDGPVGKLKITTDDTVVEASRRVDFGYQVAFDRTFNTPRCHLCVNHGNFLADIVVGDAWLPSTVSTRTGISLVVNRNSESDALMRRLERDGHIQLTEVTTNEIKESQKPRIAFGDFAYAYADYRREQGLHAPVLDGPNRRAATLSPRREVAEFHKELTRKLELQRSGRYRYLYWRKATKELPRLVGRYWEWFTVRILRVKSVTGERQELSREQVEKFR